MHWASGQLDLLRAWGERGSWKNAKGIGGRFSFGDGGRRSVVTLGRFDGVPRDHDEHSTRTLLVTMAAASAELVVLLRDRDGVPGREPSVRRAVSAFCSEFRGTLSVCVGIADLEIESWVLSGFVGETSHERECLKGEKARLGFDPTLSPERLTDKHDSDPKSPKRVLDALAPRGQPSRRERCWRETSLVTLRERGAGNGLSAFLNEAEAVARACLERG